MVDDEEHVSTFIRCIIMARDEPNLSQVLAKSHGRRNHGISSNYL